MVVVRWCGIALLVGCGPVVGAGDGGGEGSAGTSDGSTVGDGGSEDGVADSTSESSSSSSTGSDVCLGSCDCEPTGALLWRRTQPPPASERILAKALARLDDGRLVVAGRHTAITPEDRHGERSIAVAIFDREAALLSSTTALAGPDTSDASALGVATDGTNVAVTGYVNLVDGDTHGVLIVYDDELQPQWSVEQDRPGIWNAVTFDADGGVIATGSVSRESGGSVAVVDRFAADGALLWSREAAGTDASRYAFNHGASVGVGDGRIWVVGSLYNAHDDGNADVWTAGWGLDGTIAVDLLYDSGTELEAYATGGSDYGEAVAIAPSGDVLTVGSHYIRKDQDVGYILASERWARLVDRDGNELWRWWHDSLVSQPGIAHDAAFDACGNAFVVGTQQENIDAEDQLFVAKLAPDGQTLWDVPAGDISSELDAYAIVVDDDGSAVVMTAEDDDTVVLSRLSP